MNGLYAVTAALMMGQVGGQVPSTCANGRCTRPVQWSAPRTQQVAYTYAQPPVRQAAYTYAQPRTQPVTYRYVQPVRYAAPTTYRQATTYAPVTYTQTTQYSGHAGGFLAWLNSVRAQHGLRAVGYDSNLEAWASQNNAAQSSRGLGHFVMGPARRQNAAMMASDPSQAWLRSPGHRSALLDPTISNIGLAFNGQYWTMNAY